jgi:3-oxoacyl-[acyl-carrier protein] reductase
MATHLDSRVAIVTGGSRGIGLAVTAALLDAGARVVISGLSQEHLDSARQTLSSHADRLGPCAPTCGSVPMPID